MDDTRLDSDINRETILAYDIGGTSIQAGLYNVTEKKFITSKDYETPNYLNTCTLNADEIIEALISKCAKISSSILNKIKPKTVVIAYPGPITADGAAIRSPTILGPELDNKFPIKRKFEQIWPDSHVILINDLVSAGYYYVYSGKESFCVINVGSGIGNKVFNNGKPLLGNGLGGEIGHLKAFPYDKIPFEYEWNEIGDISSGKGTLNFAREWKNQRPNDYKDSLLNEIEIIENEDLVNAFQNSDPLAIEIINSSSYPLSYAIACIHQAIGTDCFIITGGFACALGESYTKIIEKNACTMVWNINQNWEGMIQLSQVGTECLYGAAYLGEHQT